MNLTFKVNEVVVANLIKPPGFVPSVDFLQGNLAAFWGSSTVNDDCMNTVERSNRHCVLNRCGLIQNQDTHLSSNRLERQDCHSQRRPRR